MYVCILVNFMGKSQKTKPEFKTLNPCYYQTFLFDDVAIPSSDDFMYSPQVLRLLTKTTATKLQQLLLYHFYYYYYHYFYCCYYYYYYCYYCYTTTITTISLLLLLVLLYHHHYYHYYTTTITTISRLQLLLRTHIYIVFETLFMSCSMCYRSPSTCTTTIGRRASTWVCVPST